MKIRKHFFLAHKRQTPQSPGKSSSKEGGPGGFKIAHPAGHSRLPPLLLALPPVLMYFGKSRRILCLTSSGPSGTNWR